MKWGFGEPKKGDIVRVKIGRILHYGIYVDDDEVIQFGLPPTDLKNTKFDDIEVLVTSLNDFILDSFLEVAILDKKELKTAQNPDEIVRIARSRLGEKGYNILHNNCEHFVNEVVFSRHTCLQEEAVRKLFKNKPLVDVYYARIPGPIKFDRLYPEERYQEILNSKHPRVKKEKYYVWKLLEIAIERSLFIKFSSLKFNKLETGKWVCDKCYFSLSHTDGLVVVAVSKKPIGIDVEMINRSLIDCSHLILNNKETKAFNTLKEEDKNYFLLSLWTKKEAMFKQSSDLVFDFKKYEDSKNIKTLPLFNDQSYLLSVVSDDIFALKIEEVDL